MKAKNRILNIFLFLIWACLAFPFAVNAYPTRISASEEYPPATCEIGDVVYGAKCTGSYCDNTRLYCADTNFPVSGRTWSDNFSEERTGLYYKKCNANQIMTGISCSGSYCDKNSIECSTIPRTRVENTCAWVGPYSEETGDRFFGSKYANGMMCTGSYCDNHYYYICNYR